MRIVGGSKRGLAIAGPKSQAIRPTSDRTRQAVFNILEHGFENPVVTDQTRVLDLFAGTGALGFEALSRGAAYALFVDEGTEARGLIRQNMEAFGSGGISKLYRRNATRLGTAGPHRPFDLVFCDPPYGKGLGEKALRSAHDGGWIAAEAMIVVEEAASARFMALEGFREVDRRPYGDTEIIFLRLD